MVELDKILKDSSDIDLKSVIEVRVSEDVARERILGRVAEAKEGEARSDDNEEVFKKRMKIYTDPLPDIQKFYEDKEILHVINGERTLDEVVEDMEKFIKERIA